MYGDSKDPVDFNARFDNKVDTGNVCASSCHTVVSPPPLKNESGHARLIQTIQKYLVSLMFFVLMFMFVCFLLCFVFVFPLPLVIT